MRPRLVGGLLDRARSVFEAKWGRLAMPRRGRRRQGGPAKRAGGDLRPTSPS